MKIVQVCVFMVAQNQKVEGTKNSWRLVLPTPNEEKQVHFEELLLNLLFIILSMTLLSNRISIITLWSTQPLMYRALCDNESTLLLSIGKF